MNWRLAAALLLSLVCLAGCEADAPLRIGFLAGLSGRGAVSNEDGRNGAILAVEQHNAREKAARPLELLVQDNGNDATAARAAMAALLTAHADAIVGPFASSVAVVVLPQAQQAGVVMISPNATASVLAGKDDQLLMLNPSTREVSRAYAELLWKRGQRRIAVAAATDAANAVYAVAWRDEFGDAFRALGGQIVARVDFDSNPATAYGDVVQRMLAGRPDGLVFVCGTLDAVRLAQQARKQAPELPMAAADAAAGESLATLGGRAVEGVLVGQLHDRASTSARYQAFMLAYQARFSRAPGYHAMVAYDAVTVLAQAAQRRQRGESMKQAVLRHGPYDGLQQPIAFDASGDAQRAVHFTVVHDGRFEALP